MSKWIIIATFWACTATDLSAAVSFERQNDQCGAFNRRVASAGPTKRARSCKYRYNSQVVRKTGHKIAGNVKSRRPSKSIKVSSADGLTQQSVLNYTAVGQASWYGGRFHGRRTANGEIYDMYAISGAHRTLPLPSLVRVTNLANQRSLIVRLNDRGPYYGGRLIDLSVSVAKFLGFYDQGLALVRVEFVGRANLADSNEANLRSAAPGRAQPDDAKDLQ